MTVEEFVICPFAVCRRVCRLSVCRLSKSLSFVRLLFVDDFLWQIQGKKEGRDEGQIQGYRRAEPEGRAK